MGKRCKSCGACQECGAQPSYPQPVRPWPVSPWPAPYPTTSPYWSVVPPYPTITYSSSSSTAGTYVTFKTDDGPDETGAPAPLH